MQNAFSDSFPLRSGRVHEVCGAGAAGFAAMAAAQVTGHVPWIREAWLHDALNPVALADFIDPARILLMRTPGQTDSLAVAEEALKDTAVRFVVIQITRPLNLREGRRLQLAAKAGGTTGLCLIPEGMGSNAAETRWRAVPVLDPQRPDSTLMRWEIIKNKSGTNGAWHVRWDEQTHHLLVVSPAGN
ncbi:hypothetical protein MU516_00025 [Paracoccus sp. YLB-12]|uniref:Protein ImuA n=1 Tax=Paracoccus maritimus TaxID=2933292 RepID=A0ABT2K3Y4_9RHOB|nr:hypothetical protein [Paracoccus sp. YLB-12]MCT4331246.1 hypothetical protein [Paracoccus sp. YLB-12]